ncbi:hypothetical protein Bca101_066533 [Brassica carinata]
MDSSHYNLSYGQWNSPYSPHPPPPPPLLPPPPPPPPRQSHPDSPNFYVPSTHSGGQRHDYHHYSHRQDLPPNPAVDYPSSYYPQQQHRPPPPQQQQHPPPPPPRQQHLPYIPQQVSYESQRALQPSSSSSIPCTESRDVSQSAWVGYKGKRVDSWTDAGPGRMDTGGRRLDPSPSRDYQYDYSRRPSRDSSGVSINRGGLDGSSRSRDEFRNTGYVRKESRIDGSYQDRGQLKAESDRCFRGLDEGNRSLASRVGYGSDRYGVTVSRDMGRSSASHEGTRNQRWDEAHNGGRIVYPRKKDDYYHSEVEQYFDRGRREESSELNRTPKKKSALLRLETPRNHQKGRENGRNHSSYNGKRFNSNSFRGKEHVGRSDRGLVEKQRERTPVDLDVSFESNLLVAKPIASPASAGIHPSRSVTPRSFKTRRVLVPDKSENPSATEGNGKLRTQFSEEASVSEGSRPYKRQNISSEIEKKPDNHSTPSSSDAGGMNNVSFVDGVVQDCEVKITDRGPEALARDSEAKVRSTVHAAENISSFCEALKEAKDDSNVERDSNMGACSIKEDVIDGDKSILKSQDVLDRTGCNAGEALPPKVMEMENIVKASTNRSPTKLNVPLSTAADLSECPEPVIRFSRKSMCSVESSPCEDVDMDCSPSRNVPMQEVSTSFEERIFIGSSVGSLVYVDEDLEKSSRDASIYFNREDPGDQATAKLDIGIIEDGSNGINKNVDSLSPENDCRRGLVSSASLEIPSVSTELANANNYISGDFANAHSSTIGTCTNTIVDSPDMSESKNPTHCEDTVNPSVENGSRKESMETMPLSSVAEMADNLNSDEGKKACVKGTSSYLSKVDVKGSLIVLPVERTDGYSRSDESELAMAVCMENVSAERLAPDEDLGLASHYPAEIPSVDQLSGSNIRSLKARLPEPNISLNKDITDGSSEALVQRDVSQNDSTFCGNLPSSPALVTETNLAVGINSMSTNTESGPHESQPCSTVCKFLPEDRRGCGSSGAFGSVWNLAVKKNLEEDPSRVSACLVSDNYVSPGHISPLMSVNEQIQNKTSIQSNYSESQGGIMHEENNCAENIAVDTQEAKTSPSGETSKRRTPGTDIVTVTGDSVLSCNSLSSPPGQSFEQIPSEIHVAATVDETCRDKQKAQHSGGTSEYRTQEPDIVAFSGDSVPFDSLSNSPKLNRQIQSETHAASMVDDSNNCKEKAKPSGGTTKYRTLEADVTSDVCGQEKYSRNSIRTDISDGEALSANGKVSETEILGDSGVHLSRSHSPIQTDVKVALTHVNDLVKSVPDRDPQNKASLSSRYELEKRKKKSNYSTQKSYPPSLPFVSDTKKNANPPNKHHTWHRKPSPAASSFVATKPLSSTLSTQQKFPIVTAQSGNSYVRKGNSLLRKPSYGSPGVTLGLPLSAIQLNRIENKSTGSASRVDVGNASFLVKGGEIPTLEKQSKPPSDSSTSKVSNAIVAPSGKCALSYSMDHLITGLPESIMDSATSGEASVPHSGGDTSKTSDTPIQTDYASDSQQKKIPPKLDSSDLKRTVYVKRKANQLVASSDIHGTSRSQIPTSDGYFKRSKNQLVRTSESHVNHSPDDTLDSRPSATMVSEKSSTAFSDSVRVAFKSHALSEDLATTCSLEKSDILEKINEFSLRFAKWFLFQHQGVLIFSQKLSTMRKRHTVYTRSTNGYSLRKSKVLSIGGSHLKWSKSIERDSRKANEEATLAVAAFSKKENEKHSGQSSTRKTSRNHLTRKRIFRFGSLRYKMDPSRRTLQRISGRISENVDSPCSGPTENGKGAKRPFIPKRLVIGYEEYVRVGNGNQLVRDPKKRTRALANEKVRWSLHNVRLRLAKKKKKYCQFFTRFGKCNKDDGKCPYVHDPSKVAVCTKFLNGLCANENCKLTHKVIPERMPDCSYFLQGLCNNEACPYRHVHVNPSAAICDGFLKGYCSDGDECRKKHSYTCPDFEATGSCSQGSKCKLHHPKKQGRGRKRKRPSEPSEKNARGRYFGSLQKLFSESEPMVVDRRPADSEDFGTEGIEFISLGATEDEAGDNNEQATEQSISSDSEEPASIYDLIRPVALMR